MPDEVFGLHEHRLRTIVIIYKVLIVSVLHKLNFLLLTILKAAKKDKRSLCRCEAFNQEILRAALLEMRHRHISTGVSHIFWLKGKTKVSIRLAMSNRIITKIVAPALLGAVAFLTSCAEHNNPTPTSTSPKTEMKAAGQ
jgi:hypothetical protein